MHQMHDINAPFNNAGEKRDEPGCPVQPHRARGPNLGITGSEWYRELEIMSNYLLKCPQKSKNSPKSTEDQQMMLFSWHGRHANVAHLKLHDHNLQNLDKSNT
jgi:hypothetical protein